MTDYIGDDLDNTLTGGVGNDRITGRGGNDTLTGGAGNDVFVYDTRGFGDDVVTDFNTNGDRIDLSFLNVADLGSLLPFITQDGADVVITLGWNGSTETIRLSNVSLASLGAADFVFNTSTTPLAVTGTLGDDVLFGGKGDDTFVYGQRGFGNDTVADFDTDGDRIELSAFNVGDIDSLRPFMRQDGADVVIALGWNGLDETIRLANVSLAGLGAADFVFNTSTAPLTVAGTGYDDLLFGGRGGDTIDGNGGRDILVGGSGNDILRGGADNDTLIGGAGDDRLIGESQADRLTGGGGNDAFAFTGRGFGSDVVTDFDTNGDRIDLSALNIGDIDSLTPFMRQEGADVVITFGYNDYNADNGIESIRLQNVSLGSLSAGDFIFNTSTTGLTVVGTNYADVLFGGNGNDTIRGGGGSDTIVGGAGDDTLSGGDRYITGDGSDLFIGGAGADTLLLGWGNDTLVGGAGNDTFKIDGRQFGDDTIADFDTNGDRIDLSLLPVGDLDSLKPLIRQDGADVVITFGYGSYGPYNGNESIRLQNVSLSSLSASDFVFNTSTADRIVEGTSSKDVLFGLSGNDTLYGKGGNDTLVGGAGSDTLIGGYQSDTLIGGAGNDVFVYGAWGSPDYDRRFGNDIITDFNTAGDKIDVSRLNIGDFDSLKPFMTQTGADVLIALYYNGEYQSIRLQNTSIDTLTAVDFVFSTSTSDLTVDGTDRRDILFGGKGDDTITGRGGDDGLVGGAGNDEISGGGGGDRLSGGTGSDIFVYDTRGFGHDTITDFDTSGDKIDLSFLHVTGFNSLLPFIKQDGADVVITLGWGGSTETIRLEEVLLSSLSASDFIFDTSTVGLTIRGAFGDDVLFGGNGNDIFVYGSRGFGNDILVDFDTNGDRIDLSFLNVADLDTLQPFMKQDGQDVIITLGYRGGDESIRLENVSLSSLSASDFVFNSSPGNLTVKGDYYNEVLFGGIGNDTIDATNGSKGNNTLVGGAGDDRLYGRAGDDVLRGGKGADQLIGGDGIDTASYYGATTAVTVNLGAGTSSSGDAQGDTFSGIENASGGKAGDTLIGSAGINVLNGSEGNDVLRGGAGADELIGGTGSDTASYYGATTAVTVNLQTGTGSDGDTLSGVENVNGGKGGDSLTGNAGANALAGYEGNDTLRGGAGLDFLAGGTGADRFVYTALGDSAVGANADRITDFSHAQGDRIDLSAIDANTALAGNQAFSFIGSGLYTGVAGQLRFAQSGGNTTIAGDINGDGTSDFHIIVKGTIALQASDFVL